MSRKSTHPPSFALILLLFFFSGALALVYQVVWARMMTQVFGSTALAVGTVLAAFMAGMALGSWTLGKLADRSPNGLRLYAWLELGIALSALLAHLALDRMVDVFPVVHGMLGGSPMLLALARFAAAFLLVMVPTVLMGATLPVLSRFLVTRSERIGAQLSTLYSINTLGAVTGVVLTGFVLIGRYGIHMPVFSAVIGNLLIGAVAWVASRHDTGTRLSAQATAASKPASVPRGDAVVAARENAPDLPDAWALRVVLFGLGISGFTSFAYEIYWTRSLVFILGNSTYALTTMLSAFLTGIALGSYLVRFAIDRFRDRVAIFGWIQVLLGVLSALALPTLFAIGDPQSMSRTLLGISADPIPLVLSGFGVSFLVMLVPAALIGATFPLVGHLAVRKLSQTGASVGRVYAINTLGNVLGALLPGVFLLGWLGIQRGILSMAVLNVTLGIAILATRLLRPPASPAWKAGIPILLLLCLLLMTQAPLKFQFPAKSERPDHQTLYYREGPLATTKVFSDPANGEKHMSVDGIIIGGTGNTEYKQLLLAHLPRLLTDNNTTELSIGLGSGILAGQSARHPDLQQITVVEIEPSVIEGAGWFARENRQILDDPRLQIVSDDVGNFLRTTSHRYQVISADEKTADEYASNGFSYSADYYQLLLDHLTPDGLVAQWVPATLPPRQYRMILNTFAQAFPYVQLWSFLPAGRLGPFNSILIGSRQPVAIDAEAIDRRFEQRREALVSLEPYGLTSADALIPHFVADQSIIRDAVADAPLNTLDHPRYEFYQPWEYARDRVAKVIANQAFFLDLKRRQYPDFLASVAMDSADPARLEQTFAAEFRFLEAFQRFLGGIPLDDTYRLFDEALAMAPWNDSLRARIYAQYSYIALTQANPERRQQMARRARALYDKDAGVPEPRFDHR